MTTPAAKLPLNADQQAVSDAFFAFLLSDEKEMGVEGPPGVGKTFWMGHAIDEVIPTYHRTCQLMGIDPIYQSVEMTATTNKAAEALSQHTGRDANTIHKYLALKVKPNFTTGVSELIRTKSWLPKEKTVLFVDESSMIDTPLDRETQAALLNCKIVYVGDRNQLAPVKEAISPVYKRKGIVHHALRQPMRTALPELQALVAQLRHTVETGEFLPIVPIPGIIDWLDDDSMPQQLAQHFAGEGNGVDARVLAYTNARVNLYNDWIRSDLNGRHGEYLVGEKLVCGNACHLKDQILSVETGVTVVDRSSSTEMREIDEVDGTKLEVRLMTLESDIGRVYENVPVPVDRAHYAALIAYYKGIKRWRTKFHLEEMYPDLRPRSSATTHKAQGSTHDAVFVDLGDISTCHQPNQVARMLYVALSRMRHRVFLYGKLAAKYGGQP